MAIKSLLEITLPEDIIDLDKEEGRPQFVFPKDQEYGIAATSTCYSLMKYRFAGRSITEGENVGKVEKYKKWEDVDKYTSTPWGAFKSYLDYKTLMKFKDSESLDFDGIKQIYIETLEVIRDAVKSFMKVDSIKKSLSGGYEY